MSRQPPLRLEARREGDQVFAEVVGSWATPFSAQFVLQVESGGNRSAHRGNASGPAVSGTVFSRYNTQAAPNEFRATLEVIPSEGAPYQLNCTL
jgi:hypothetical protein